MRATAKELDSSNSSDALLMNCFCFPGAVPRIMKGLGLSESMGLTGLPEFGVTAKLPKTQNRQDATELDMRIGTNGPARRRIFGEGAPEGNNLLAALVLLTYEVVDYRMG